MSRVFVFKLRNLLLVALFGLIAMLFLHFLPQLGAETAGSAAQEPRVIHMVTVEFKTKAADGGEIEVYRWEPGTIVVRQGELVKLSIYGLSGASHPFVIEGLNVKGEVKNGKETTITFRAPKKGTYRIICIAHPDLERSGPMIGYIESI